MIVWDEAVLTGEGCAHVEERLLIIGSITLRRGLLHVAAAARFVAGDQCSLCRTVRGGNGGR